KTTGASPDSCLIRCNALEKVLDSWTGFRFRLNLHTSKLVPTESSATLGRWPLLAMMGLLIGAVSLGSTRPASSRRYWATGRAEDGVWHPLGRAMLPRRI